MTTTPRLHLEASQSLGGRPGGGGRAAWGVEGRSRLLCTEGGEGGKVGRAKPASCGVTPEQSACLVE